MKLSIKKITKPIVRLIKNLKKFCSRAKEILMDIFYYNPDVYAEDEEDLKKPIAWIGVDLGDSGVSLSFGEDSDSDGDGDDDVRYSWSAVMGKPYSSGRSSTTYARFGEEDEDVEARKKAPEFFEKDPEPVLETSEGRNLVWNVVEDSEDVEKNLESHDEKEQLLKATLEDEQEKSPAFLECQICFNHYSTQIYRMPNPLACGHLFCRNCTQVLWKQKMSGKLDKTQVKCPICRWEKKQKKSQTTRKDVRQKFTKRRCLMKNWKRQVRKNTE